MLRHRGSDTIDIRKRLHPLAASAWNRDPFACGSYSYAEVGHADARTVLAAPVDDRLFFAGEAVKGRRLSDVAMQQFQRIGLLLLLALMTLAFYVDLSRLLG